MKTTKIYQKAKTNLVTLYFIYFNDLASVVFFKSRKSSNCLGDCNTKTPKLPFEMGHQQISMHHLLLGVKFTSLLSCLTLLGFITFVIIWFSQALLCLGLVIGMLCHGYQFHFYGLLALLHLEMLDLLKLTRICIIRFKI